MHVARPATSPTEPRSSKLIDEAVGKLGRLDILVTNAGVTRDGLFLRMKDEQWDEVIAVNLKSTFMLVPRRRARHDAASRLGRIIGITSVVGVMGNPGQTNYAASKAGMIGLTKSLAQEIASRGITANCVAPGFIETPMTDALNEKQTRGDRQHDALPAGFGRPRTWPPACVYLASDEAAYVTGQTLHVNGGMAMI